MGRGLSNEQKRILEYLELDHKGAKVIPAHWLLMDLYGIAGTRQWGGKHPALDGSDPNYATARASLFRSLRRLRERGLINRERGFTSPKWNKVSAYTGEEQGAQAWGYVLTIEGREENRS